ncbi:GIY-YIG nuclease family protein [Microbacterium sp. NPDC055683]
MNPGKQVLLYLVDGMPGGLRTAEIANWTGHVIVAPRPDLARLIRRDESHRTGVYVLLGDDMGSTPPRVIAYIGETDEIAARLRQHQLKKDWWDRVAVITSQAQSLQLTKSQVRYLEGRLIARARETGRATLDNGSEPSFARLSEAETSSMDYFLEQLYVVLPTLGIDIFRGPQRSDSVAASSPPSTATSPIFSLGVRKRGIEARAQLIDGEFVVLAGSTATARVAASEKYSPSTARAYANYRSIHDGLIDRGTIILDGPIARFAKDAPFASPSTAGAIVLGRSCNGRTSWLADDGTTYGQWEGRGVETDV